MTPNILDDSRAFAAFHEFCTVIPRAEDLRRCESMATLGQYKDEGVAAKCAILIEAARRVHSIASSHLALDVIASVVPSKYVDNWAKKRLGLK